MAAADASDTLWISVQQLPPDAMRQVQSLYGVHFPIEVRHFFAAWIEDQPWSKIDEDNPLHEDSAADLRESLIGMIEAKAEELISDEMFLTKIKLQQTVQQFRELYGTNPMNLIRVLKNCLATEQRLVDHYITLNSDVHVSGELKSHRNIMEQFRYLHSKTQEIEESLRELQHKQESFILQHQEYTRINAQITSVSQQPNGQTRNHNMQRLTTEKQRIESELRSTAQNLLDRRMELAKQHKQTFDQLSSLQTGILDEELISWKRQQQLAGNGGAFEGSLETLQQWCESLAELIWMSRQQIKRVEIMRAQLPIDLPPGEGDLMPYLNTTITGLLSSLVTSTFIIEKQPPQVLKKDAKFTATVRLLVGGKLNVHMNPPVVKATIISEEQAKSILKNDKTAKNETSGDIVNSQGQMEYHSANGQLAVMFRNMQLKRIRRAEKKGNETVTEEKFSVLFQSQFTVGGGELVFQVWTLSLPVVVTVHGNQECNAVATILWDNAFAEPGRIPFQVPDAVPWPRLAKALNTKFASACGSGLSPENISYLASKIFDQQEDYSVFQVTWSQFNREPLIGRNFTFWEWFYAIMKLTKDWLQGPWKQRSIVGFISKQKAQDWLTMCCNGAFLLRFSDSEIGGITIAWVTDDPNKEERQVWNLAPFTEKDFKIRGLGDRIKDLGHLTFLYPDIPKNEAFGKFWSQDQDDNNIVNSSGYVRSDLATTVPKMLAGTNPFGDPRSPLLSEPASPVPSYGMVHTPGSVADSASSESTVVESMDSNNPDMTEEVFNDMFFTDYNPSDIDRININELLAPPNMAM